MALVARVPHEENWIETLAELPSQTARQEFLRPRVWLHDAAIVERLYEEVVRFARVELRQATNLSLAARWLAESIKDDASRALSFRARGHVLYLTGHHVQAVKAYETALKTFRRLHRDIDVGRTYTGALQPLIYLGHYSRAIAWARRARRIYERHGDRLRLARLDLNLGNIYYRQDRFGEALKLYSRAYREFQHAGDPQDIAIALRNLAVCYLSLNQFSRSLEMYVQARCHCERYHLPVLVAEVDYNIAYLHYIRGEYTLAIQMYEAARQRCERVGDAYHKALCDLDESELYLEINLIQDGTRLAEQAFAAFKVLGMRYEAAKALTFVAIGYAHQRSDAALVLLRRARKLFVLEKNRVWSALTYLYEAMVLYEHGNSSEARLCCQTALAFFRASSLSTKAAACELLLARLDLGAGDPNSAEKKCSSALKRLRDAETPAMEYQAWLVQGQTQEALERPRRAFRSYEKAHKRLESLRSQLRAEAKLSFQQDKLTVYESLVRLSLSRATPSDQAAAFSYIEHAKSRSLADLISFRSIAPGSGQTTDAMQHARELRQELNWISRRIELEGVEASRHSWEHIRGLRKRARKLEHQLVEVLPDLWTADANATNLETARIATLQEIRSAMPRDTLLLEYYAANGTMHAALLGRDRLHVIPLAAVSEIKQEFLLLQFQLSKFRLGPEYLRTFSQLLRAATQRHLQSLFRMLIGPLTDQLNCRHLIIVPHDILHRLPFHALFDGEQYLIDRFSVSYAPSASVYYLCSIHKPNRQRRSVVMGFPDPLTPHIAEEVEAVAKNLPNAELFVGPQATANRLRSDAPASRFLHIATHGQFRADNPMFSSIRLADSTLSLYDLYDFRLNAELVTLSGCGTGLNVVTGGDELLGLVRGFFYSGAQAVLVTLWDVNDRSTADFMRFFYANLARTRDKSAALKDAMHQLRRAYPDVYHWAPFVLTGKFV